MPKEEGRRFAAYVEKNPILKTELEIKMLLELFDSINNCFNLSKFIEEWLEKQYEKTELLSLFNQFYQRITAARGALAFADNDRRGRQWDSAYLVELKEYLQDFIKDLTLAVSLVEHIFDEVSINHLLLVGTIAQPLAQAKNTANMLQVYLEFFPNSEPPTSLE